jgi:hypothetical protein
MRIAKTSSLSDASFGFGMKPKRQILGLIVKVDWNAAPFKLPTILVNATLP